MRLALTLSIDALLGVDGGAYLLSRNAVLGDEPTGAGFPRPPLAPGWQLLAATWMFGDDVGYKVWSAIASLAPITAVYFLSRKFLTPWQSLAAAALISVDLQLMEMLVTGALPLQGFSLIAITLGALWNSTDDKSRKWVNAIIIAIAFPLTFYVNQTSAGLIVIVAFSFWMFTSFANPDDRVRWFKKPFVLGRVGLIGLAGGSLIALSALPWYIDVRPLGGVLRYPGPLIYFSGPYDTSWFQFAWGLAVGVLIWRIAEDFRLRGLGLVISILSILLVFMSYDETIINIFYRSRYLVELFLVPCAIWLITRRLKPQVHIQVFAAAAVFILFFIGSVWTFYNQQGYSEMVSPETVNALTYLREQHPGENVISNAFTISLWIAAMNKVKSPHTWTAAPPERFISSDKDVRCVLNWSPGCDWRLSASRLQVTHVLIDDRFPYYNSRAPSNYGAPDNQWAVTEEAPWLNLIYTAGTTRLWAIEVGQIQ